MGKCTDSEKVRFRLEADHSAQGRRRGVHAPKPEFMFHTRDDETPTRRRATCGRGPALGGTGCRNF
eukprot:1602438-Prymnesium_polylepis.1